MSISIILPFHNRPVATLSTCLYICVKLHYQEAHAQPKYQASECDSEQVTLWSENEISGQNGNELEVGLDAHRQHTSYVPNGTRIVF